MRAARSLGLDDTCRGRRVRCVSLRLAGDARRRRPPIRCSKARRRPRGGPDRPGGSLLLLALPRVTVARASTVRDAAADGLAPTRRTSAGRMRRWPTSRRRHVRWGRRSRPTARPSGVTYPHLDVDAALAAARSRDARMARRRSAGAGGGMPRDRRRAQRPSLRDGQRRHAHDGQPFVMAFQAGGPHAQDRALEAIVGGLVEQERVPATEVVGEAGQGRRRSACSKDYRVVPRGVALVIGCNTFPTWNAYPGPLRLPGHRQPGHRQAPPARGAAARDHRGRSPETCYATTGSTRSGAAGRRGRRRGPGQDAGPAPRDRDHRLHRRPGVRRLAGGEGAAHGQSSSPRRPASTRSSSTRPTTCAACWATSRSRCPSTPARCARPRRTSTSPRDGIDTDEGHLSFEELRRPARRRRSTSSPATTPAPSRSSAPPSTTTCAPTPRDIAALAARLGGTVVLDPREVTPPAYPDAVVRAPGLVALDASREDGLHARSASAR